ncbi:phosphoadenosine phosphosulfate sulfotransferase [Paraburkholderia youngii]|uniref:phosphoadenosine phosphosulfate sulfotransferase n=1 Tax=Paraburkholderia youngii TaxID=2782701 RepID=UPI003D1BA725
MNKYETFPLFEIKDEFVVSVEQQVEQAVRNVKRLMASGWTIVIATSGGKDSSLVTAIALHAATEYAQLIRVSQVMQYRPVHGAHKKKFLECLAAWQRLRRSLPLRAAMGKLPQPLVVVTSTNTRVENPETVEHVRKDMHRISKFAKNSGFKCITEIIEPSLLSTWQVSILSGRALPSYAGMNGDCSTQLKIVPARSFRRQLFRDLDDNGLGTPVTLVGTRFSESQRRAAKMRARGDRADEPVLNKDGEYVLTPIAHLSTDDVWEGIALYAAGVWPSYSDFEEVKRIYADAGGTSCAVVSDAILEGAERKTGKCGARFGCAVCLQAEDKSLATMVQYDPRYAYAAGLLKLNKFLRAIRYDWSRRNWVGRTIIEGYIAVGPDTFHPKTIREIGRYMLQLDYDEQVRARLAREKPKFQLMPADIIVALDAMQSLYAVARPFALWADYRDIFQRGIRYDIPDVEVFPPAEEPESRFLFVGKEWDDSCPPGHITGMRDPYREALTEMSACAPKLVDVLDKDRKKTKGRRRKPSKNAVSRYVWEVPTGQKFEVDIESVGMLVDFELDRMLEIHDGYLAEGAITWAYKWYLSYGTIQLSHSQQAQHDTYARRSEFKDRLGLTLDYDHDALIAKSVRFRDLPEAARRAWAHKATTDGSQTEIKFDMDDIFEGMLGATSTALQQTPALAF